MDQNVIIEALGGVLVAVLGYLLKRKDDQQEKDLEAIREKLMAETKVLWAKHDEDADKLRALEIRIASEHYVKRELDERFDKLARSIEGLGHKIDEVLRALIK